MRLAGTVYSHLSTTHSLTRLSTLTPSYTPVPISRLPFIYPTPTLISTFTCSPHWFLHVPVHIP